MDKRDIERLVKEIINDDKALSRSWGVIEDVLWNLYESEFSEKKNEMKERLINYCQKNYEKAVKIVKRQGIDLNKLKENNWRMFFEWCVNAFINYEDIFKHDPSLLDEVIIYGETVGFLYEDGKWTIFEPSYEYGEMDRYLYKKIM